MNNSLQLLISLCHQKNELNRKRRRFAAILHDAIGQKFTFKTQYGYQEKRVTHHISKEEAKAGYEQAKKDMKAMTSEMRRLRNECGAILCWGSSGNIRHVMLFDSDPNNDKHFIAASKFKAIHEMEQFESNFFKGDSCG